MLSSASEKVLAVYYTVRVYVFQPFTSVENSLDFPRYQVWIELSRFPTLLLPHPQKGDAVLSHDILL